MTDSAVRRSVRSGSKVPSPYLRRHFDDLLGPPVMINKTGVYSGTDVLDLGCGNGRNSEFMKGLDCKVVSLDMKDDYGTKCILGHDPLPAGDCSFDAILINYVLMFMDDVEMYNLAGEIGRVARPGCRIMVENYPAKNSRTRDKDSAVRLTTGFKSLLGWNVIRCDGMRFVAANTSGGTRRLTGK